MERSLRNNYEYLISEFITVFIWAVIKASKFCYAFSPFISAGSSRLHHLLNMVVLAAVLANDQVKEDTSSKKTLKPDYIPNTYRSNTAKLLGMYSPT